MQILLSVVFCLALADAVAAQGSSADYERARELASRVRGKVLNASIRPEWISDTKFWYRSSLTDDRRRYWLVDAERGAKSPLFDHDHLASKLGAATDRKIEPDKLPIEGIEADADSLLLMLSGEARLWRVSLSSGELTEAAVTEQTPFHLVPLRTVRPSRDRGQRETSISFVNNTLESVRMFWVDRDGQRRTYNRLAPGETASQHTFAGHVWVAVGQDGSDVAIFEAVQRPSIAAIGGGSTRTPADNPEEGRTDRENRRRVSDAVPVFTRDHNLFLKTDSGEVPLTTDGVAADGYGGRVWMSPDGKRAVVLRTKAGGDRKVTYVESTPRDQLQPRVHTYDYLKPGDEIPLSRPRLFDLEQKTEIAVAEELFPNPWSIDEIHWTPDSSRCLFLYNQRGHRVMRVLSIDGKTGEVATIVNEEPETFFDYAAKTYLHYADDTNELIWMSERDGWNHLYLYDSATGELKNQITSGEWVVRGVDRVDEEQRVIHFRLSGHDPKQDPYHIHHARIGFDGSGMVLLTSGDGTHDVVPSPGGEYLVDTWSRADLPPRCELRSAQDGSPILQVEAADCSPLLETGWKPPQRFVAPGRDGTTPIHGLIHRPTNFDTARRYPVIENIYAGPHGAHVPKDFRSFSQCLEMAELGFIVVQIDGMGTNWRSKAFHDVAWKNLRDAGFPDRIAWLKAAAKTHPEMDLENDGRGVGIYGGSAGGQNAMAALLWHGDFYKVAASDCGCHDNRMDKIWWNELWMSWPVGPHYEESSNVVHAHRLPQHCRLLLTVGEMDENVDPASTLQVANALIEADKDFEMLVLTGTGHGSAETPYGRRRRQDFFVEHLLGKTPRW